LLRRRKPFSYILHVLFSLSSFLSFFTAETADPAQSENNTEESSSKPSAPKKRLRTAFTTPQLRSLELSFRVCPYPDSYGREQIAGLTGVEESKIQVWFQNRRARYRKREKPLEAQQSSSCGPTSIHPSTMMQLQAYFAAAALQAGGVRPQNAPGPPPVPQQFYAPGSPFFATGFATMPAAAAYPLPGYYPYPTASSASSTPMDLMAAAAQIHANANGNGNTNGNTNGNGNADTTDTNNDVDTDENAQESDKEEQ
jgi:hypothetical protein